MVPHIGCEAFGAAEEFLYTCFFKRRNAAHRIHQQRFEMFKTACDFVKAEIFGNSVHTPWPRIGFKRANEQLARVIFIIAAIIIIAQNGEGVVDTLHPFKQHIIMLTCMQWRSHADARRQIARPHAATDHDIIGINRTVCRINARHAVAIVTDFDDFRIFEYLCAAGACAFGKRLRYIDGVGITITRDVNAADDVIDIDDVRELFDFLWRHHMDN